MSFGKFYILECSIAGGEYFPLYNEEGTSVYSRPYLLAKKRAFLMDSGSIKARYRITEYRPVAAKKRKVKKK